MGYVISSNLIDKGDTYLDVLWTVKRAFAYMYLWGWSVWMYIFILMSYHGPLARYVKLRVAHAPGMSGTFSPPPRDSDADMHHDTCVKHVSWCMPGSLTSGFLWTWWQGKRSQHSRRMRNPQFYLSDKRPMEVCAPPAFGVTKTVFSNGSSICMQ